MVATLPAPAGAPIDAVERGASSTVRHQRQWWDRLETWVGVGVVVACCVFVLVQLQPDLLLRNTTTAGGDTGAHVWWPAYLRDHLLAQSPAPALFAVGATIFLFFKGDPGTGVESTQIAGNQHIMGGNLASNFAGEYSFTLALALGLFFLRALAYSLDHRRKLWLPAVLLGATVMSHLVVAMFVVIGAVIVWLARRPRRNLGTVAAIGGVGALLTAVWTVPLLSTLGYTTDMGYEPIRDFVDYMFPWYPAYVLWMVPLIVVAIVGGILARRRVTLELVALTAVMGLAFRFWEGLTDLFDSTPVWNLRLLPFWYF